MGHNESVMLLVVTLSFYTKLNLLFLYKTLSNLLYQAEPKKRPYGVFSREQTDGYQFVLGTENL